MMCTTCRYYEEEYRETLICRCTLREELCSHENCVYYQRKWHTNPIIIRGINYVTKGRRGDVGDK